MTEQRLLVSLTPLNVLRLFAALVGDNFSKRRTDDLTNIAVYDFGIH